MVHTRRSRGRTNVEDKFAADTWNKLAKCQHLRKVAKTSGSDLIEGEENDAAKTLEDMHTSELLPTTVHN